MLRGAGTSNFGLIAPDGGLIVDLRGLVGDPQVRDGAVSAPAGTLQRDMEKAARASGFEMPVLTTTYAGARSPDFSASMLYGSDWQTADALNYLNFLGATAFAWEFLRREPTYQADYQSMVSAGATTSEMSERVAHRGLECAVAPNLRADCAPVVWQPDLNPTTVIVTPAPDKFAKARSISELTPAFSCCSADGEHWLLGQGSGALSVKLIDGASTTGPSAVVIPFDSSYNMRVEAAICLGNAMANGTPARTPDTLTAQQRSRLKLILRSLDGSLAGYSYREIAEVLFGPDSVPAGRAWTSCELYSQIRRLCNRGHDLMNGAYLDLLRYPRQFRC
jgi:hypothetical protein